MFTGIVTHLGKLLDKRGQHQWHIGCDFLPMLGESISVNGACLTVKEISQQGFWVDVSSETLDKTTGRNVNVDAVLNLERALKVGDSMGGHWVSGHVDDVARVTDIQTQSDFSVWWFQMNSKWDAYFIEKGSVCIHGISLTLNEVKQGGFFSCTIIPHTFQHTNLHICNVGSFLNIEIDHLCKLFEKKMQLITGV